MPIIHYKFPNGHTEEIEVTEEVAAAFELLEKYEKKVERKERRRHVSLNVLLENGFDFPIDNADILDTLDKQEQEKSEWKEEQFRRHNLDDKKKEIFSFVPYKKQIENIEDYGGMPQEKNTMQDDEEEYNEIGTEPIHLGEPQITDQDNSLEAVANEKELSQELLKFLEKEGEERRNFYVASVENTGEKNYKAVLDFVTKRSDGKNITVTFEDGIYTFSLE